MRGGLKKPAQKFQSNIARFSPSAPIERQLRAKTTEKHSHINRFGNPKPPAKQLVTAKPVSGELISAGHGRTGSDHMAAPLPSMVASASHQKLERLLDEALTSADTHKQALRYHAARHFWQRRWLSGPRRWVVFSVILLLITGGLIFSWQKVPQLSVRFAGLRAHLSPSVPAYKPDGYKLAGPAKAVSGVVTIKYVAGKDSQSYDITQAQSNLTSSLVGQSVVPKGAAVQTSQVNGNTVYIYGNSNDAAWVNNGVLYTVKDHANLSSDELINIVRGLNP